MNAQTVSTGLTGRRMARIYALEVKCELLKTLRLPAYAIPTIAFPLVFYFLFGIALGDRQAGAVSLATYLLATYGAFGVIGASLFGFGVGVAVERGQGWLLFKRATPMPPMAHLAGRLAMSLAFSTAIVLGLFTLGATLGGVSLSPGGWAALFGVLLPGALVFGSFGLALGYWLGPNSAAPVVNLVYLPLSIVSGLWIPIQALPKVLQGLAPFLPPYHYSQLALKVVGADQGGSVAGHVAALLAFTAVSLLLARAGFRRDEGRTFG